MIEKILAGATLAVCIVLLLRLVMPATTRRRVDRAAHDAVFKTRQFVFEPYRAWRLRKGARRMADEAIRRARGGGGEWTGNVYRPKSFQRPPKSPKSPKDLERPRKEH